MKIGIDARFYSQAGVGRYLRNLISSLQRIDKENEYFIFLNSKDYESETFNSNFKKIRADISWYGLKEQIFLPKLLSKFKLDLVHFPHFNIPIFYKGKYVVTIHDLIHQHFAMKRSTTHNLMIYKLKHQAYNLAFSMALKKSKKIITVSEYVKNQLTNDWRVSDQKIEVTLEAAEEKIIERSKKMKQDDVEKILAKFNVKPPYIFYVGNAHPHKNVEGLIKAYLAIRKKYQYLTLVLAGHDHFFWQRIKNEYPHKDIKYLGFIEDNELIAFYKGAKTYVLPSYEEGFGIPLLEAMACKTPVVCSDAGSLKEVGGEAALYFNPNSQEDMIEKIKLILNDNKLRDEQIKKGEVRYKMFSWDRLAEQTHKVYMQALEK